MTADAWKPVGIEKLEQIIADDLRSCSADEIAAFEKHRVTPYAVPIIRLGKVEEVLVVATFGSRILYYEDVEEGFELAELDSKGQIPDQGCNQYSLEMVLHQVLRSDAE